jgi:hypothetical protein
VWSWASSSRIEVWVAGFLRQHSKKPQKQVVLSILFFYRKSVTSDIAAMGTKNDLKVENRNKEKYRESFINFINIKGFR